MSRFRVSLLVPYLVPYFVPFRVLVMGVVFVIRLYNPSVRAKLVFYPVNLHAAIECSLLKTSMADQLQKDDLAKMKVCLARNFQIIAYSSYYSENRLLQKSS